MAGLDCDIVLGRVVLPNEVLSSRKRDDLLDAVVPFVVRNGDDIEKRVFGRQLGSKDTNLAQLDLDVETD